MVAAAAILSALVVLSEIAGRTLANPAVTYMLLDKQLHCLEPDGFTIGLCPDVNLTLRHPRGFEYRISTNARGERRASELLAPPVSSDRAAWVLGDSIAMGFGVHDRETFPYRLAAKHRLNVANLGVDGLGARAVLMRFRRALKQHEKPGLKSKSKSKPILALRIVHPSDFLDDERDERYARAPLRAALFRAHFRLARWSALYNWMRWFAKYRHVKPPEPRKKVINPAKPPASTTAKRIRPRTADLKHPTFKYTEALIREARGAKIPLVFVIYPAWNGGTGLPRSDYKDLRGLPAFIESRGGRLIDLAGAFRNASDPAALYIPGDGHPSAAAARVFLRKLEVLLPK